MAKKARKGPKTLFDKVKEIDSTFPEAVYSMTDEKLNEKLASIAKEMTTNEELREQDMDLKSLQEQVRVASEGYNTTATACKLKRKFIYSILKERGKVP